MVDFSASRLTGLMKDPTYGIPGTISKLKEELDAAEAARKERSSVLKPSANRNSIPVPTDDLVRKEIRDYAMSIIRPKIIAMSRRGLNLEGRISITAGYEKATGRLTIESAVTGSVEPELNKIAERLKNYEKFYQANMDIGENGRFNIPIIF